MTLGMNEQIGEFMTAAVSTCFLIKSPLQVTKCFSVSNLGLKHKGQWAFAGYHCWTNP